MRNIAILAGGYSSEREVSIGSGNMILEAIDKRLFNAYLIDVKKHEWIHQSENKIYHVNKDDFSITINNQKITFDGAVIMIHGTPGEDGKLQGYFELMDVPYSTCDVLTSSLTFNKYFCKRYLTSPSIPMSHALLFRNLEEVDQEEIEKQIGYPCFVKPNNGGSSCGISKIKTREELLPAFEKAFHEDPEVIIESFIPGRELTCGLMMAERELVFPICEVIPGNDFFDYDAKYTDGKAKEVVPADITPEIENACKSLSKEIYQKLNCKGIVRIDYILNDNKLYFLEVNTVPGMSKNSIVPKMIRAAGFEVKNIITELIDNM